MSELNGTLSTYAELAEVLDALPLLVRERRRRDRLSLRDAATQAGTTHTTLTRCEQGDGVTLATAVAILRWLDTPASPSEKSRGAS